MRPWTLNVELATNTTPLLSDLCKVEVTKHSVSNLDSGQAPQRRVRGKQRAVPETIASNAGSATQSVASKLCAKTSFHVAVNDIS